MININELIKEAMKSKNKEELLVYQAIKTEITNYKTAKNAKPYDELAEISLLKKMVKQREDSEKQYLEAGRKDLADKEHAEAEVINKLLPKPATKSDIMLVLWEWAGSKNFLVQFNENPNNFSEPRIPKKEMGNAIKYIKESLPQADGKNVSEVVKEYLI